MSCNQNPALHEALQRLKALAGTMPEQQYNLIMATLPIILLAGQKDVQPQIIEQTRQAIHSAQVGDGLAQVVQGENILELGLDKIMGTNQPQNAELDAARALVYVMATTTDLDTLRFTRQQLSNVVYSTFRTARPKWDAWRREFGELSAVLAPELCLTKQLGVSEEYGLVLDSPDISPRENYDDLSMMMEEEFSEAGCRSAEQFGPIARFRPVADATFAAEQAIGKFYDAQHTHKSYSEVTEEMIAQAESAIASYEQAVRQSPYQAELTGEVAAVKDWLSQVRRGRLPEKQVFLAGNPFAIPSREEFAAYCQKTLVQPAAVPASAQVCNRLRGVIDAHNDALIRSLTDWNWSGQQLTGEILHQVVSDYLKTYMTIEEFNGPEEQAAREAALEQIKSRLRTEPLDRIVDYHGDVLAFAEQVLAQAHEQVQWVKGSRKDAVFHTMPSIIRKFNNLNFLPSAIKAAIGYKPLGVME